MIIYCLIKTDSANNNEVKQFSSRGTRHIRIIEAYAIKQNPWKLEIRQLIV